MGFIAVISLSEKYFSRIQEKIRLHNQTVEIVHIKGVLVQPSELFGVYTKGQIGIHQAHQKAWRYYLEEKSNQDFMIVLEDDVEFLDSFFEFLDSVDRKSIPWEMMILGNFIAGKKSEDVRWWEKILYFFWSHGNFLGTEKSMYDPKLMFGAHGYAIFGSETAKKLIDFLPQCTGHVDASMGKLIREKKINAVGIRPSLLHQADFQRSSQSKSSSKLKTIDQPPLGWMMNTKGFRIGTKEFSQKDLILMVGGFILFSALVVGLTVAILKSP